MFKSLSTLITCVLLCYSLNAQCPNGDVILSSQEEVSGFASSFPNCTEIAGNLTITGSDITDLSALSNLTDVEGSLLLRFNFDLDSLAGLDHISSVEGNLEVSGNNDLATLSELANVSSLGGSLLIGNNNDLTSLTGLDGLSSVPGDIVISRNDHLISLAALNNISSLGGMLVIAVNNKLTTLAGLESISAVGGNLDISLNEALVSLAGLDNITSVDGEITIIFNDILTDITAISNISPGTISDLRIRNNPLLAECAVESVCTYLMVADNPANIENNTTGCTDRMEVEAACITAVTNINNTRIELFPNPTTGQLQMRNMMADRILIFNTQGQLVAYHDNPNQELDISTLPAGSISPPSLRC